MRSSGQHPIERPVTGRRTERYLLPNSAVLLGAEPGYPAAFRMVCDLLAGGQLPAGWQELDAAAWELAGRVALAEGAGPLAARALEVERPVALPERVAEQLRVSRYETAAHNAMLLGELDRVMATLVQAEIPAVVFKGADLARTLYPDPALRPMSDLDLLVRQPDWDRALAAVESLGYRPLEAQVGRRISRKVEYNRRLGGGPGGRVPLELHWGLTAGIDDRRWVAPEAFWAHSVPCSGSETARRLAPTAHLLYLAAHLMVRHGGCSRLIWLVDLHLLVRSGQVDWHKLAALARDLHLSRVLGVVLQDLQRCLRTALPPGLLRELDDDPDPESLRLGGYRRDPWQTRLGATWQGMAYLAWPARMRLVLGLLFPRPEYIRWRYTPRPGWVWPAWYLYRWFDVLRDGVATVAASTRHGRHEPRPAALAGRPQEQPDSMGSRGSG